MKLLLLLAVGLLHAQTGRVPTSSWTPETAAVWSTSFEQFLSADLPDPGPVRDIARTLAELDGPVEPLAATVQASAERLLAAGVRPGATEAELAAARLKLEVLNYPAVRALLTERQQSRVGAAAWAYNDALWDPKATAAEKVERIAQGLERANAEPLLQDTRAPPLGPGPEVAVTVQEGDIEEAQADALVATVEPDDFCRGGVNAVIERAGGACFRQQFEAAKPLPDGKTLVARGDGAGSAKFRDVVFVSDARQRPLHELVLEGLRAADRAGLTSVTLPAMRTGSVFGAVERSRAEIVAGLRRGVEAFLGEARRSLKSIRFVIRKDAALASALRDAWAASPSSKLPERERSLRTDMREATLSGDGFSLDPRPTTVEDRSSPNYASLLEPWDLKHLLDKHAPVRIGTVEDEAAFSRPAPSVLNMRIKLPGSDVRVPKELGQFREILQKIIDHEAAVNPDYEEFYAYLTIDQRRVEKGTTQRRPGVHIDGVQGARYPVKLPPEHLYSVSDRLGTVFYDQAFDLRHLDPAKHHVHAELERQADESRAFAAPDHALMFWDSYSVHRADVAPEDLDRTFLRVEFSRKVYDAVGDTPSPLFGADWERVARPIPADLDDRPVGYDPGLASLAAGAPHTVKDLPRWIEENLGRDAVHAARGSETFFIIEGDGIEQKARLEAEGWTIGGPLPKDVGFHTVHRAAMPDGKAAIVVLRVNGRGRVLHLQSFLKLLDVPAERIVTRRGFRSWRAEYLEAFRSLGRLPDLVVYGLARPAVEALLARNVAEKPRALGLARFWRNFNSFRDAEPASDISRRSMKVVTLSDGRVAWVFQALFGELAGDLMEALLEHGVRDVLALGTAGSLDAASRLGDWFTPAAAVDEDGRPLDLTALEGVSGVPRTGTHRTMATSNTQTRAWLDAEGALGSRTVDMEFAHLLAPFARRPGTRLRLAYTVTDVMAGPDRTDLTETRIHKIPEIGANVRRILDAELGPAPVRILSVENKGFRGDGR